MVKEDVIEKAIGLLSDYDRVAPPLFQRVLSLDLDTAEEVFDILMQEGLLQNDRINPDDPKTHIADVNKEALHKLHVN